MSLHRRSLLAFIPVAMMSPLHARADSDPRLAERTLGRADAPVTVIEFFSLTCPHCARFSRDVLPRIRTEFIDPGKLRWVYRDYPLDQVALTAAMVARALPPERYDPFCTALLARQDRWAYDRSLNTTDELAKMAALAGLSRQSFDATIRDQALRDAILKQQADDEKTYKVDSTPSFIINGPNAHDRRESGEKSYEEFAKFVAEAAG